MKRLRWLFNVITAIILLVFSLSARGADSPQATIQAAVQEILTVLQDPGYQGPARRQGHLAKAEEVILSNFDKSSLEKRSADIGLSGHRPSSRSLSLRATWLGGCTRRSSLGLGLAAMKSRSWVGAYEYVT